MDCIICGLGLDCGGSDFRVLSCGGWVLRFDGIWLRYLVFPSCVLVVWDLVLVGCGLRVYVGAVGICLVLFLVVGLSVVEF